VLDQRAVALAVGLDPAKAGARDVHAVVAARAADDDGALLLALRLPVAPGELHRGVDRVRPAAGQEDARAIERRVRRDPLAQLEDRSVDQVAEGRVRREPPHLRRGGVGDLSPTEADVAVPEAGGGVDVAPPGLVVDHRALAPIDDQLTVGLDRAHVRERVPERLLAHGSIVLLASHLRQHAFTLWNRTASPGGAWERPDVLFAS
jgi:hypothetical protein